VVLTFDDGCRSDVEFVAPLLRQRRFGATFFVNDRAAGKDGSTEKNYLTWKQIRRLHEAGFEIGNHTAGHPDVRGLSKEQFLKELESIEQRCAAHGIPRPTSFAYPGFEFDQAAARVLKEEGYLFARRGVFPEFEYDHQGGRGPAYDPAKHHPLLIPVTGFSGPHWGMADLAWAVERAQGGRIAVLCFHGVPDVEHPWVHTDPQAFVAYMDFLRDSGCSVIAMRDLK
jgi:peptidoglycan/xylan/chitin deacetylase (PgdA/CDA1 family)